MGGDRPTILSRRDRRAVDRAVGDAELQTGLQFCVYLGPAGDEDARARAESLFVEAGLHERPSVLLLVAPDRRQVEIVTAPPVRDRLPDEACARAIQTMTPLFATGRFVDGLIEGLRRLADEAGPRSGPEPTDLPNILGDG
ncbi:MAG: DUF5130 family protein [Actinomycetota bacterium]